MTNSTPIAGAMCGPTRQTYPARLPVRSRPQHIHL